MKLKDKKIELLRQVHTRDEMGFTKTALESMGTVWAYYKTQGDTVNWKGVAAPNGTCVVSYKEDYGIILTWSGKADPSISKEILKKGEKFPSLEAAYDAYLKALGDSKYDSVRQS